MNKNTILWGVLIGAIFVTFIFNQILAILITVALLSIALIVYLISLSFKKKLIRSMERHLRIIDMDIALELDEPIEKIRKTLDKLLKNQKSRWGLLIFLNNRYIYYNNFSVDRLLELFDHDLKEKEILEQLRDSIGIRTRAEVKVIKDTLINHKKQVKPEADKLTKVKDQIRKSEIY